MSRWQLFALVCLLLAGCVPAPPEDYEEPGNAAAREQVFRERWARYREAVEADELQPDCRPRLIEPSQGVEYRGTVVLLHGFSACPQQFFELAEDLAAAGYRTILPLLPGHGLQFGRPDEDRVDTLPDAGNWQAAYEQLAIAINGLMEYADGERIIGGLSVGGAASLYVSSRRSELYDRQIVFAPFFAPGGGALAGQVAAVSARTPVARSVSVKPFGIKQPCLDKRAAGRAGFCNYQLKHVGALTAMGAYLQRELLSKPLPMRLQFVGVEKDPVVSNERARAVLAAQADSGLVTACFMPQGVPHAMISAVDSPGAEMYWLEPLYAGILRFVRSGDAFPSDGTVSDSEAPFQRCRI